MKKLSDIILKAQIQVEVVADGTISAGDVLTFATTAQRVIRTTTFADSKILGVAATAGTIGQTIKIVIANEFDVTVNDTVAIGDFLSSSATAGRAESDTAGPGNFAIAMTSGTAGQTVKARYVKSEAF